MDTIRYLALIMLFTGCVWDQERALYREELDPSIIARLVVEEYMTRNGPLAKRCEKHLDNIVYVQYGEPLYDDSDFSLASILF